MLELAIARALFDRFPEASEGRLAKIRAHVVSRHSCAGVARELGLGDRLAEYAKDIPAAELQRISRSRNVLAALLEAAMAAVYLEYGFDGAAPPSSRRSKRGSSTRGRVTSTTRRSSRRHSPAPAGRCSTSCSRSRDRRTTGSYVCAALVDGEQAGVGRGSTKKAAEQEAAALVLRSLGVEPQAL